MMLLQATSAFLNQMLPAMAPLLRVELGWSQTTIGYLVAASTTGSILFLTCGAPLVRGVGAIRAVQMGLLVGAVGTVLLPVPLVVAPFLASIAIGLAYGPATPAGSDVLMRYAPARHLSLVFSLKQAGVPIGGAAAGLLLPFIASVAGWRVALLAVVAVLFATILLVQGVRARVDAGRDAAQLRLGLFLSRTNLTLPFRALRAGQGLQRLALAGGCLAVNQGGWNAFLVTYVVGALHMTPVAGGIVFAVMQGSGALGRIGLGWLADRLGAGMVVIRFVAGASALSTVALGFARPDWPFWVLLLIAVAAGITVSGWNGLQLAEIARRAPAGLVGEASAGGTVFVFLGFIAGPILFALVLAATGRFDVACFAIAVMPVMALALVGRMRNR